MVGVRNDQGVPFSVPEPHAGNWRTVGEVLGGLPEPPDDYTVHRDFPNHQRARVTPINIKRFSFVPKGGGWQDIRKTYGLTVTEELIPLVVVGLMYTDAFDGTDNVRRSREDSTASLADATVILITTAH